MADNVHCVLWIQTANQGGNGMAVRFELESPLGWGFVRGNEQIIMDRLGATSLLIAFNDSPPQVMVFHDSTEAVLFDCNLETELRRTGWTEAMFDGRVFEARPEASLR